MPKPKEKKKKEKLPNIPGVGRGFRKMYEKYIKMADWPEEKINAHYAKYQRDE